MPVPLYHTYLGVVTPSEVVNQFTGRVYPGFSHVPEGHRCTGLEHFFSALATSISTVARTTMDRGMLIPPYPENIPASSRTLTRPLWSYRVPLYSPDPVVSPPVARPLAHISMITSEFTKLSHFPDHVRTSRSPRVFSVRQSLVAIVGPHTGAREGTIQTPARGSHSHHPSPFSSSRARGARQCLPPGAGRYTGFQHGPHPCTGVQ